VEGGREGVQVGAHAAGWWKPEPQQAFQPVSPSHIVQDEQLAQKLQQVTNHCSALLAGILRVCGTNLADYTSRVVAIKFLT
jgi:hypothetical protein